MPYEFNTDGIDKNSVFAEIRTSMETRVDNFIFLVSGYNASQAFVRALFVIKYVQI